MEPAIIRCFVFLPSQFIFPKSFFLLLLYDVWNERLFYEPHCPRVFGIALVISSAVWRWWTLWLMAPGSQFHLRESVTLTPSRKSPTCYSTDCDHAMYFSVRLAEGHYPAWIVSRLLLVWQRCRFRLEICLRGEFTKCTEQDCIRGRRRN